LSDDPSESINSNEVTPTKIIDIGWMSSAGYCGRIRSFSALDISSSEKQYARNDATSF